MQTERNQRILLVDDNPAIHDDFKKILTANLPAGSEVDDLLTDFLGAAKTAPVRESRPAATSYEISTALQGQEALSLVQQAREKGRPFALVFVDVRMPPGWDGIVTLRHLFEVDPELQAVICTAYSDYSYADMVKLLGHTDRLLILKKPFDPIEVQQLASALIEKWHVARCNQHNFEEVRAYAASLETVNRALASDKAMAEAFSQSKTDFIVQAGQLVRRGVASMKQDLEQACSLADSASSTGQRLQGMLPKAAELEHLLQDVLLLAELEANRLAARAESCNLPALLEECSQDWQRKARSQGRALELTLSGPLPRAAQVDTRHLRSMLGHLVDGILDLGGGAIRISIGLDGRRAVLGSLLRFEALIAGLRLDPDAAQALFEPFCGQKDHLHLALAKGEARLLRAELFVESGDAQTSPDTRIVLRLDPGLGENADLTGFSQLAA
jgi:two-component system, sensor histidine kinase and response regulator